jgi:small-conductance mechanosensitive channel
MENWFSPQLVALIRELGQPGAYIGLLLIALSAPVSWSMVRTIRGPEPRPGSIWFGGHIFDGVLFPALWLLATQLARRACLYWHLPLAVFKLAIPILVSLVVIRLSVRVMRAAFPASTVVRVAERTISWLAWGGVVLWITGVLPSFLDALDDIKWKTHGGTMTLLTMLEGVVVAGVVLVVSLWISAAIEQRLLRGALGSQLSWRKAAANLVRTVLVLVGLLVALSAVGIDLTALSVLGGAIGVGLGFGLQKLASNYVSGFVILAERAVRIGDTVKVDGFEGCITDIKTRYTVLRALNGRESIVPNELLITQRVESSTLADPSVLVSTVVQVGYDTDLDALLPKIVEVVAPIKRVLADPAPSVGLSNFAADGLELTVSFWIRDPENGTGGVRSEVNLALLRLFAAEKVEIPFPQRVVRTVAIANAPEEEGVVLGPRAAAATTASAGSERGVDATAPVLAAPASGAGTAASVPVPGRAAARDDGLPGA